MAATAKLTASVCLILALATPINAQDEWRTFAFALDSGSVEDWAKFDWDKLTTVAIFGELRQDLVDFAHSRGCRVVHTQSVSTEDLDDPEYLQQWINQRIIDAAQYGLDGINLDYEGVTAPDSPQSQAYTQVVADLVEAFHSAFPGSEVSVDVAWNEPCVDGRCYDYAAIGQLADLVFVMGYDLQSQMWDQLDPCYARPNAPAFAIAEGIDSYLSLGIEPSKLILGTPWYGYDYTCVSFDGVLCEIEHTEWRGCNCSDFVGTQRRYADVVQLLETAEDGRQWDEDSQTPFFNFQQDGVWHQMWYDDPASLAVKYSVAHDAKRIGGVGMWNADCLDYQNYTQVQNMWGAFP